MLKITHKFILVRILFIISGDLEPIDLCVHTFLKHLNIRISNINMISLDISKIIIHVQSLTILPLIIVKEGLGVDQHRNYDIPLLAFN